MQPLAFVTRCLCLFLFAGKAHAHTSEQGFVLLLPTDVYITSGVCAVLLTIVALVFLPHSFTRRLFTPLNLIPVDGVKRPLSLLAVILSTVMLVFLMCLLFIGFTGTHDPLRNLLPLFIWTIFWIALVSIHGFFGNLWYWVHPWQVLSARFDGRFALPHFVGCWPGIVGFLLFISFALADTAPEDPARLSWIVGGYFMITLLLCYLFGAQQWLNRGECFTMLLQRMATVAPIGLAGNKFSIGFPGWKAAELSHTVTVSGAVFTLTILASGSFDGLNETFWWLQRLGINPLEFPGRSAVVLQTVTGLFLSVCALLICFSLCSWLGTLLGNRTAGSTVSIRQVFNALSVAILPIALAYHVAHYLTAFMVNVQYTVGAMTDPLQNGRDLLGLGQFYVTTGFFNTQSSVRTIWLTQAGAVVLGHIVSILLSHRIALRLWPNARAAMLSQIPMAIFMVLYTLLGLWLLAAPRGA